MRQEQMAQFQLELKELRREEGGQIRERLAELREEERGQIRANSEMPIVGNDNSS